MIQYLVSILTEGSIFAIMALGLNIIWGWSGDFDLAFYGYVALGAYMTLVLTVGHPVSPAEYILGLRLPFPVAVLAGVASAVGLSFVVGSIALRHLRGIYFSIVTLGAVYVVYVMAGQFVPLFDGYNGLSGLFDPMGSTFRIGYNNYQIFYLGLCVLVLVLIFVLTERLSGSRFGLALRTLRDDERASAAFGRDIFRLKLRGYMLGAAIGGLAGGLFAGYLSAFNPSAWSPIETIVIYASILVGGRGSGRGVVLGVFLISVALAEATRFIPQIPSQPEFVLALREVIIGLVLVLFLRFRPQGILPERRRMDRGSEDQSGGRPASLSPALSEAPANPGAEHGA